MGKESSSQSDSPPDNIANSSAEQTAEPAGTQQEDKVDAKLCCFDPNKFVFACIYPECTATFEMTNDLYGHIREHDVDLHCPYCGIRRNSMSMMVNHVRTHTGLRPYRCPLPNCNFGFSTKGILRQHLVSKKHREEISLDMLNAILSFDTKNGRPQVALRGPRDRLYGGSDRDSRVSVPRPLPLPPAYVMQQQQLAAMYHNQYRGYHQQQYPPMVGYMRHSPLNSMDRDEFRDSDRDEFGRMICEDNREFDDAAIRDISEYIG